MNSAARGLFFIPQINRSYPLIPQGATGSARLRANHRGLAVPSAALSPSLEIRSLPWALMAGEYKREETYFAHSLSSAANCNKISATRFLSSGPSF